MDSLCNGHQVQVKDLKPLKFSAGPGDANKRRQWTGTWSRIDSRATLWEQYQQNQQQNAANPQRAGAPQNPDWLNHVDSTTSRAQHAEWGSWLDNQRVVIFDPTSTPPTDGTLEESRLSIVASSLVKLTGYNNRLEHGPTALRYVSIEQDLLLSIAQTLHIHRRYFKLIEEGSPCMIKINSSVQGRPCEVYLLRTSNAVTHQTALAITHFPPFQLVNTSIVLGARTNALISGISTDDLTKFKAMLHAPPTFPPPAHLITAFLELEKTRRFTEVRIHVRDMQTLIHGLGSEPIGSDPSARRKLNNTVDLYFVVQHLRTDGLIAWREQLRAFGARAFPPTATGGGSDDVVVMMGEYLEQLGARYDHRISRCDTVLQGTSLAYQMETTQLSRKDTEIAIGDGKTMKAIAVLTMVFLPGTFIAVRNPLPHSLWAPWGRCADGGELTLVLLDDACCPAD
ncbi:hypothetical protein B0H67DRAFT_120625 [Lasiosphaeris hirsuta]|uniref:Uncharacterized protein n=1 Tax=Lasiosphaeris hirsuta TaxID=260670 RepID=A0AA40B001_9PEZI|nr:hypothetical protein B0H67DRAFT_120625 [Lasiosphaeris hirsuta]